MPDIVTLYTSPNCGQCIATKRELDKYKLDYQIMDITQSQEALDLVRGLGYMSAPVVLKGDNHWSGFRPDKIKELINEQ